MMLILQAQANEMIVIGGNVKLHVYIERGHIKIAFDAPKEIGIERMPVGKPFTDTRKLR